ncbi:MAG: SBBP repeat-containing protein [Candidatus Kariarchaeaceae archaeon]
MLNTKISFFTLFFLINLVLICHTNTNALSEKNDQLNDLSLNEQMPANLNMVNSSSLLVWSTFLGGSEGETSYSVATDSNNNVVVTGYTWSDDFPTLNGYDQTTTDTDAFLTKFDSSGVLLWSTYLGGSGDDNARSLAVDSDDCIIVTGHTWSDDFPILNGNETFSSENGDYPNGCDVFVAKFDSSGDLLWSTYLGGSENDYAYSVAITSDNSIVITGHTYSGDFPSSNLGYQNIFVTKFDSSGNLIWSNCLGGSTIDTSKFVAIDSNDNIIITGHTSSSDFPTLNGFSETFHGGTDVFLTKLDSSGVLIWSTFLGGGSFDYASSLAIDSQDCFIITGWTQSSDFPTLNGYDQTYNDTDAFLTKFDSSGALLWSTYLGGSEGDNGYSVTIDSQDYIIAIGHTRSSDFPIVNSDETSYRNNAYVTIFNSSGNLIWSAALGGTSSDFANSVAIDSDDCIVIIGQTQSSDFPVLNANDEIFDGDNDVFVTKLLNPLASSNDDTDNEAPIGSFLLTISSFTLLVIIYRRNNRVND